MEFGVRITIQSPLGETGQVDVPEFANWLTLEYQSVLKGSLVQVFQGILGESQFDKIAHRYHLQATEIVSSSTDIPYPDTTYLCPHLYKFLSGSESKVKLKLLLAVGTASKYETKMLRELDAEALRDLLVESFIESDSLFDLFPLSGLE